MQSFYLDIVWLGCRQRWHDFPGHPSYEHTRVCLSRVCHTVCRCNMCFPQSWRGNDTCRYCQLGILSCNLPNCPLYVFHYRQPWLNTMACILCPRFHALCIRCKTLRPPQMGIYISFLIWDLPQLSTSLQWRFYEHATVPLWLLVEPGCWASLLRCHTFCDHWSLLCFSPFRVSVNWVCWGFCHRSSLCRWSCAHLRSWYKTKC